MKAVHPGPTGNRGGDRVPARVWAFVSWVVWVVVGAAVASPALGQAGTAARPGAPVAVIEDLRGPIAGLELMDYVSAGRVIRLLPGDRLVLGYLHSCWRETITGGTVTVGTEQSSVQGGRVERTRVPCDTGRLQLGAREATQGAATVYRSLRPDTDLARPAPPVVYGLAPLFDVGARRGGLVIERLDAGATRIELPVEGAALVSGRFVDLARTPHALAAGATYEARLGTQRLEFKVDWDARPGATPVAGRLLRFD